MVQASGVLAAIAQAFGGKRTKAMAAFGRALHGGSPAGGDSSQMSKLRKRIQGLVNRGAV